MPQSCGESLFDDSAKADRLTSYDGGDVHKGHSVSMHETLLRFAPLSQWDAGGLPTAAALSLKKDEDGLSVFLQDLLRTRGLDANAIIERRPQYGVFAMPARVPISAGNAVEHDSTTSDPPHASDFAHALILPSVNKADWKLLRAELLASATVVIAPGG